MKLLKIELIWLLVTIIISIILYLIEQGHDKGLVVFYTFVYSFILNLIYILNFFFWGQKKS